MNGVIGLWSHALAAVLVGALALWQLRQWKGEPRSRPLAVAFGVTALWALLSAALGPKHMLSAFAESGRNFAFLTFMYAILCSADEAGRQRAVKSVYAAVGGVIGLAIVIAGVLPEFAGKPLVRDALTVTGHMIGFIAAAGSLLLVHNLYGQAAPDSRWGLRLPMIALAAMWTYDLHLHTVAYLTRGPVEDLYSMRGAILAMLVPLFALASRRNDQWRMQMSRAATFQSISLMAILAYLILMMSAARVIEIVGGNWARVGQIGLVFAMTVLALILLPSGRLRAWARVVVTKHFFEHRYDYRQEWLRFTRAIGLRGEGEAGLGERVVKALADLAESPAGLLLLPDETGRLGLGARWNWTQALPAASFDATDLVAFLEGSAHIIDFSGIRSCALRSSQGRIAVPEPLAGLDGWAGVPLLHNDRLVGLAVLGHPVIRRPLDWEDFDLFRTAGIQAASYLAEARTQEALADAQRFDEFNRRFAFIMHDIKNLVSQLSLVARNAERHAHNPDFRADMIATLQGSVKKMNDLLARLNRGSNGEAEPPRHVELARVVAAVAELKRRVHPLEITGDEALAATADPARLEQALAHLGQNAIDASAPDSPVMVHCQARGAEGAIEVIDRGTGMSPDFIRSRLFQPFASTKESGFGVGAFEARTLIAAMGGRIEVDSREGEGSRFTILLPLAETSVAPLEQRMCA